MMINAPAPVAVKPPAAPAAPAAPVPSGAAASAPAPATTAPAAPPAGTPAATPPAAGQAGPVDAAAAAAAKAQMLDTLTKTTAVEAMSQVDSQLAKVASLSVGGGTPQGVEGAKLASALLTDASMMLQHAHTKALEQLRTIAGELHLKLMSSSSGLAYMGGQVALAGQSKSPVNLAEVAAGPIAETKATMAEVAAVLDAATKATAPATPAVPAAPALPAAPAAPAAPAGPVPAPAAANGNGGVAGAAVTKAPPHLTPGPGVGKGPHPD